MSKIIDFKNQLETELFQYEYNMFPKNENGLMTCEDFAKSILCYTDADHCKMVFKYLKDEEFTGEVTMAEYISFQHIMTDYYNVLSEMVKGTGFLTEEIIAEFI